jgi:hypothetical protein
MRTIYILLSLGTCLLVGCHKQPQSAGGTSDQSPPPGAAALPAPPKYVEARTDNYVRQGVVGEVNNDLTVALRSFVSKKNRMPQSFAEFASSGLDGLPNPPEGKRWVIDASDRTVKAVAK